MIITLPDGTQQTIPDDAWALPFSGQQPTFQSVFLQSQLTQFAADNKEMADKTLNDYAQWKILNTTNRDENLAITPKPIAPPSWVFHNLLDKSHTLYFWQTTDGPPVVGYACPDLDPLVVTPNGPIIGNRIGDPNSPFFKYGPYFQGGKLIGTQDVFDTTPNGVQVPGTSADGVKGVFMKISEPWGGGIWELLPVATPTTPVAASAA